MGSGCRYGLVQEFTTMQPPGEDPIQAPSSCSLTSAAARAECLAAIRDGRLLLKQGEPEAAMQRLQRVFDENRAHAQVRSWYGLTLGLARRRFHEALELCLSAVKQEFFNPELYVNVAQLNLAFGFKAESLRYLRRAQMIDPGSPEVRRLLDELGPRARPVLRFLPRGHLLNRWLGSGRHVFTRRLRSFDEPALEPTDRDHVAA
jgi:tetratricopeptide (TPR) repeat protein